MDKNYILIIQIIGYLPNLLLTRSMSFSYFIFSLLWTMVLLVSTICNRRTKQTFSFIFSF